jgi:hypothetical protein
VISDTKYNNLSRHKNEKKCIDTWSLFWLSAVVEKVTNFNLKVVEAMRHNKSTFDTVQKPTSKIATEIDQ